jgi:transcriptional regulator with GAF, ATPase, and Fis domain
LAGGGTRLLDEIGEISISQQGELLRALQEGEFERVGDDRTIKVDVRLVAATNRSMLDETKAGRFREDPCYRISVFPVEVPPLRERIDDIAPLALHFPQSICRELGREALRITQRQLADLQRYSWPGNISELKNVSERAVISSKGRHLRLDLALPGAAPDGRLPNAQADVESAAIVTAAEFRALEKANLMRALRQADWKISSSGGAADRGDLRASGRAPPPSPTRPAPFSDSSSSPVRRLDRRTQASLASRAQPKHPHSRKSRSGGPFPSFSAAAERSPPLNACIQSPHRPVYT